MNRSRILILVALCLFSGLQAEEVTNGTTTTEGNSIPKESSPLPSVCTICNCTGGIVDCSNKGLQNHFNDTQWSNISISEVSFERNKLVHVFPFPKLLVKKLNLRYNEIVKIENFAFRELIELTELDLSHNQLTSESLSPYVFQGKFSPESYEPLGKLKVLNLGHNLFHTFHQDLFEHFGDLKVLILAGNQFPVIDSRTGIAISSLPYLEELDMSYCNIKSIPSTQFSTHRYLKKLNLTGNRLQDLPIAFEEASSLEQLYLDENPIAQIAYPSVFPVMPKLRELSLCCMPHLSTVGKGAFSKLTALEHLRLQNCPMLEEISEDALIEKPLDGASVTWPPLKKLELSDNALRYLPMRLVGRWDWLEELDLLNNKWSCDCDNQYLINSLLPKYGVKLMGDEMKKLKCSAPPEHAGKNLTSLVHRKLRCLDLYDAQPEKDAAILIGVLIGLLLAIPVGMVLFILWRRGFFIWGTRGPASYSRAFYIKTPNDEEL